jgi:hypothetical protein
MTELEKAKKELEQARLKYAQLLKIKEDQLATQAHLKRELEKMEIGRGNRVLDALMVNDAENVAWKESQAVMGKKAQLDTAKDVMDALLTRVETARVTVLEYKANCFRAEADQLDSEADERQPKTDELLAQLKEWEGCGYIPANVYKETKPSLLRAGGILPIPGQSITTELRKKASYYRECADNLLQNKRYRLDILGDSSTVFPIPEYLADWKECQRGSNI